MRKFEPSKEMLDIKMFLSSVPPHSYVKYSDIQLATGVLMNDQGKGYMRSALKGLGLEYRCDKGVGIELESPTNSMNIITSRVKRVANAVKRGHKTSNHLVINHAASMNQQDRDRAIAVTSLLGATLVYAKGLEAAYRPKKLQTISQPTVGVDPFTKKS